MMKLLVIAVALVLAPALATGRDLAPPPPVSKNAVKTAPTTKTNNDALTTAFANLAAAKVNALNVLFKPNAIPTTTTTPAAPLKTTANGVAAKPAVAAVAAKPVLATAATKAATNISSDSGARKHGGTSAGSVMYPDCIRTPAEYVQVFSDPDAGKRSRCVSPDLIGFLTSGNNVDQANPSGRRRSPFWFWTGPDGLGAYLRMGFPRTVGDWTANPNDVAFPGIQQFSNGQSLLTQIGFPALYANIGKTYALNVALASSVRRVLQAQRFISPPPFPFRATFGPASPTWANVVKGYNEALGACCGVKIPDAVVPVLNAATFRDLSGCPAQCTYAALGFPSSAVTNPVVEGTRDGDGNCVPPAEGAGALINPTYILEGSPLCTPRWQELVERYEAFYNTPARCTPDAVVQAAKAFAEDLDAAAGDPQDQAVIVRAFSVLSCSGDLNPLFTGNGFTATGFGGLFAPTSTEFISSPLPWDKLPSYAAQTVYFCITGKDGGRPVEGKCNP